ncbi:hypothetical protein [Qipengyuania sp. JC766]
MRFTRKLFAAGLGILFVVSAGAGIVTAQNENATTHAAAPDDEQRDA